MADDPSPAVPQQVADEARQLMAAIEAARATPPEDLDPVEWLRIRAGIGYHTVRFNRAAKPVDKAVGLRSASARLREYLLANLGKVLDGDELAGVAGISEWARRLRELEKEEGWSIIAGPADGLKHGTYRLDTATVDSAKAEAWRVRNSIRRREGSGVSRLLAYLDAIYPEVATKDDLAYVSKINEWPRRMRELEEAGWDIVSSVDDPTLAPGSYRLGSLEQGPPRPRRAIEQRARILQRDNKSCQDCGARPPNAVLQIHHLHHVQHGGGNEDDNLVTLCHQCHAGRHAITGSDLSLVRDEVLQPAADLGSGHSTASDM